MPSENILQAKKEAVEQLVEKLKAAQSGVLVDYIGINVADDTKLRRELREAGVEYTVVKNSILRFAARKQVLTVLPLTCPEAPQSLFPTTILLLPQKFLANLQTTPKVSSL